MKARKALSSIALTLALALGNIPGPAGLKAAGAAGVQLFVAPTTMSFHMGPPPSTAECEVTIRVIAPGRAPWRLTVQAMGPLQSPKRVSDPGFQGNLERKPREHFF